jgi:hypothetical protein
MSYLRSACAIVLCLVLSGAAPAQAPEAPIRLALRPARAPKPVLHYRLLPELREQTPGNAVEVYKQAVKLVQQIESGPAERGRHEELDRWAATPVRDLPRERVREALDKYREVFELAEKAARCERCDWGLTEQLRQAGFRTVLPQHAYLRDVARLLAVRARLEVADGRPEAALRTLQTGFAMGRHAGDCPSLVCTLVGHAIAHVMARQVDAVVEAPGAPNLYWALADFPRPYIDLRGPLEGDRVSFLASFPGLAEAAQGPEGRPLAPAQVKKAVDMVLLEMSQERGFRGRRALALEVSKKHEAAKRALVAQGTPAEAVAKMPHVQVALLHGFAEYDRLYDEAAKWHNLPYWQAYASLRREAERLKQGRERPADAPAMPFAVRFVPAVGKALLIRARVERKLAALGCVEAVRLYAASHGGRLPTTLADVKEVPVPTDPMTGKPFAYSSDGGKATLHAPPPEGDKPDNYNTFTYELTLNR